MKVYAVIQKEYKRELEFKLFKTFESAKIYALQEAKEYSNGGNYTLHESTTNSYCKELDCSLVILFDGETMYMYIRELEIEE